MSGDLARWVPPEQALAAIDETLADSQPEMSAFATPVPPYRGSKRAHDEVTTTLGQSYGPWQPFREGMTVCRRHQGWCAYLAGDPTRCDYCHRAWWVITAPAPRYDGETREQHTRGHQKGTTR